MKRKISAHARALGATSGHVQRRRAEIEAHNFNFGVALSDLDRDVARPTARIQHANAL